jgi:hypothetical protein
MTSPRSSPLTEWIRLALTPSIIRRGCGYAIVVGAILIAINHGDALVAGDITTGRVAKMLMTLCVPYAVSTLSSVGAIRAQQKSARSGGGNSTG